MVFVNSNRSSSLASKPLRVLNRFLKLALTLGIPNALKLAVFARLSRRSIAVRLKPWGKPFLVRGRTSDDTVVESVFVDHQYPLVDGFAPRTILDAGANCGAASAFFRAHYPDAEIVALEPESSNYDLLVKNLGTVDGIDLLNGALWSRECRLQIANPASHKYEFQVREANDELDGSGPSVSAFSVQQIMAMKSWQRIDLLKLDVEGSEREIFRGTCSQWLSKVSMIFVELHEQDAPGCGQALFRALAPFDYRLSVSGENLVIWMQPAIADSRTASAPRNFSVIAGNVRQ